jgi:hypothetical protein
MLVAVAAALDVGRPWWWRGHPCPDGTTGHTMAFLPELVVRAHLYVAFPRVLRWRASSAGDQVRCCSTSRTSRRLPYVTLGDSLWQLAQDCRLGSGGPGSFVQHDRPTPPVGPEWIADLRATYHTTLDSGILSSVHSPSSSLPSSIWSQMVHVFLSRLRVPPVLMAPFVFLMFLLLLLWFTTFSLFVILQLTIHFLWNLTLLVLL